MKRRELFTAISTFFGGVLSAKSIDFITTSKKNEITPKPSGHDNFRDDGSILTMGGYSGVEASDGDASVITKINLKDGSVNRAHVPVLMGHHIDELGNDEYLCTGYKSKTIAKVRGKDLKLLQKQELTEGYGSSGHCTSDDKYVYLPIFKQKDYGESQTKIEVRKKTDLSKVTIIDFQLNTGLHDLAIHDDKLFVLASSSEQDHSDYDYDPEKSSLVVIDINDPTKPQIVDIIKTPGNYTFSHIDVNNEGKAIIGTVQRMDKYNKEDPSAHFKKIKNEQKKMTDKDVFSITDREHLKGKFVLPTPFLIYSPDSGKLVEMFHDDLSKHRRLFTVKAIKDKTYIACACSETILVIDSDGNISNTLTASDYGINIIRGIAPIKSGAPYIAFGDADLGISIVNTNNYDLVRKYNVRLNVSSHLTYCPLA